jgi:hypothetical protein
MKFKPYFAFFGHKGFFFATLVDMGSTHMVRTVAFRLPKLPGGILTREQ